MCSISDLLINSSKKSKDHFYKGKDVSTCSVFDWPVVRTNKDCVSAWNNTKSGISNNNGTLQQSIRWTSKLNSHRKTNATVNADRMVIFIKVLDTEIRCYLADESISSHRYKRCPLAHNFTCSVKIHFDSSISDYVWLVFRRSTLNISTPPIVVRNFEHWYSKNVQWRFNIILH